MSNLIPEKRVNKNGIAVTKHVRVSPAAQKPKPSIPTPVISGTGRKSAAKPKLSKKQTEEKHNLIDTSKFNTDSELAAAVASRYGKPRTADYPVFTCSDAEIYEVTSVVGLDNAGMLLGAGLRSKSDTEAFLRSVGMERLAGDYSDMTTEALERGVPAIEVFKMYGKYFTGDGEKLDYSLVLDTAEANAHKGLREASVNPSIPARIAGEGISMDDLRTVGPTRFVKTMDSSGFLLKQLTEMKSGFLQYSAEEMKETIVRFTDTKGSVNKASVRAALAISREFGHSYATTIDNPQIAAAMQEVFKEETAENRRAAIEYADALSDGVKSKWSLNTGIVTLLFHEGIAPQRAADHLNNGTPVNQIIAIEKNNITPSISGGWL